MFVSPFHKSPYSSVYAIKRGDSVIYVGQSIDLSGRLKQHRARFGENVTMQVLSHCPGEFVNQVERGWILLLYESGEPLENAKIPKRLYEDQWEVFFAFS